MRNYQKYIKFKKNRISSYVNRKKISDSHKIFNYFCFFNKTTRLKNSYDESAGPGFSDAWYHYGKASIKNNPEKLYKTNLKT